MNWLNRLAMKCVLTPEKLAERELGDARLALFQAERQLLEAQMRIDYYRSVLTFLEAISANGVEHVADKQRPQELSAVQRPLRIQPDLATLRGAG